MSTKIDRSTIDRPHFFLAYGTKSAKGLRTFRETEFQALREYERGRRIAKQRVRQTVTGQGEMFPADELSSCTSLDVLIAEQKEIAKAELVAGLRRHGKRSFAEVCARLLESFMLRETQAKDTCVELAEGGLIQNTWRSARPARRKPNDHDWIVPVDIRN